jgi:diaminopimelate decarboxylase
LHYFHYLDNRLFCEKIPLSEIAAKFGTPLYVYSKRTILRHLDRMESAFKELSHLICYALKANSNLEILKIVNAQGCGADVVSGGELFLALKAGIEPKKIVFAGVGKTEEEITYALKSDILMLNVESEPELKLIETIAKQLDRTAPVSFRINPGIHPASHPHLATSLKTTKFGLEEKEALRLYHQARSSKYLEVVGIHMHLGSQITTLSPFYEGAKKLVAIYNELRSSGIELRYMDLGGGLGVPFRESDNIPSPDEYVTHLIPLFENIDATIIAEPGRCIMGNAGILLTRILYLKSTSSKSFLVVDAGMNDFVRPAFYSARHQAWPVEKRVGEETEFDVVGPVCEASDYLAKDVPLTSPSASDYLAIMTAGAYGYSMASNYNSRLRPAEVLVDGDDVTLIRERERLDDLV